jgi:hypothetical protein
VVLGQQLLIAGGFTPSGTYSCALDVFDSATGQCRSFRLSDEWRGGVLARPVVAGNVAAFAGPTALDICDSACGSLTAVPNSEPRHYPVAAIVGRGDRHLAFTSNPTHNL